MDVRDSLLQLEPDWILNCSYRPDEAGQYIATYKRFEHKPPDLIRERVDKDYDAVLRSALTSISKVNKTDVETLRKSFQVCN